MGQRIHPGRQTKYLLFFLSFCQERKPTDSLPTQVARTGAPLWARPPQFPAGEPCSPRNISCSFWLLSLAGSRWRGCLSTGSQGQLLCGHSFLSHVLDDFTSRLSWSPESSGLTHLLFGILLFRWSLLTLSLSARTLFLPLLVYFVCIQ